jgi:hypothetical protein
MKVIFIKMVMVQIIQINFFLLKLIKISLLNCKDEIILRIIIRIRVRIKIRMKIRMKNFKDKIRMKYGLKICEKRMINYNDILDEIMENLTEILDIYVRILVALIKY